MNEIRLRDWTYPTEKARSELISLIGEGKYQDWLSELDPEIVANPQEFYYHLCWHLTKTKKGNIRRKHIKDYEAMNQTPPTWEDGDPENELAPLTFPRDEDIGFSESHRCAICLGRLRGIKNPNGPWQIIVCREHGPIIKGGYVTEKQAAEIRAGRKEFAEKEKT